MSNQLTRRVRPGVRDVRARSLPISALIRLDLPTFERPTTAISGSVGGGNSSGFAAEITNRALTFINEPSHARRTLGRLACAHGTARTARWSGLARARAADRA